MFAPCRRLGWAPLGISILLAPFARAEPDDATARADVHFRRGVELANGGDFGAAALEFEAAHGLSPHPTVLFNLGQAYARSGQPVGAMRALEAYLKSEKTSADGVRRRQAEELIATTRERIGWLELESSTPSIKVLIDGREEVPLADGRIMLAVGRHSLVAYAPGHRLLARDFSIESRATLELDLTLVPNETEARGLLAVTCATPDVTVTLDGKDLGTTPMTEPVFAATGTRNVAFRRPGYVEASVSVDVKPGAQADVTCQLVPDVAGLASAGRIAFASVDDIEIIVDGLRYRGELLPAGRHSVVFRDPLLAPRLVRVAPGETALLEPPFADRADDWRAPWSYGLAISGGALLAAGATTYLVNTSGHDSWERRHDDWANRVPRDDAGPWLVEGAALDRERAELQHWDIVAASLAAAGVGAAVTAAVLWWTAPETRAALHVRVTGESIGFEGTW